MFDIWPSNGQFQCLRMNQLPIPLPSTIHSELSGVMCHSSLVLGIAGVFAAMSIAHRADDEDAGPGANHGGCDGRLRADGITLQAPGDLQGLVALLHVASDLDKLAFIHCRVAK